MAKRRIYLDNAATSWPKPDAVYAAVDQYQRMLGAPAGRGVYEQAQQVDRKLQQTRLALARLIDAPDSARVIFAYSGTDALMLRSAACCGRATTWSLPSVITTRSFAP